MSKSRIWFTKLNNNTRKQKLFYCEIVQWLKNVRKKDITKWFDGLNVGSWVIRHSDLNTNIHTSTRDFCITLKWSKSRLLRNDRLFDRHEQKVQLNETNFFHVATKEEKNSFRFETLNRQRQELLLCSWVFVYACKYQAEYKKKKMRTEQTNKRMKREIQKRMDETARNDFCFQPL